MSKEQKKQEMNSKTQKDDAENLPTTWSKDHDYVMDVESAAPPTQSKGAHIRKKNLTKSNHY